MIRDARFMRGNAAAGHRSGAARLTVSHLFTYHINISGFVDALFKIWQICWEKQPVKVVHDNN